MQDFTTLMKRRIRRILLVCNNYDSYSLEEDGHIESLIAAEITALNAQMQAQKRGYVLVGFGRWGTSIDTLGVPVKWSDISEARVLVECCLEKFRVDPSQGTHFFQNLTSFNVGYVNVDPFGRPATDMLDFDWLDSLPAVQETSFLRHVRLPEALQICVDGRENRAFISL